MNRPYTARILTSLVSLERWRSQLSNDAKIIKIRSIHGHLVYFGRFTDILYFFCGRFTSILHTVDSRPFCIFWTFSILLKIVKNATKIVRKCNKIKTWSLIDIMLLRFWWFWRRWIAGTLSYPTTPISSPTDQYWCVSWTCFDFCPFSDRKISKKRWFFTEKICRKWTKIKTLPWDASILVGWRW